MRSSDSTELLTAALCGAVDALTEAGVDTLVVGGIALSHFLMDEIVVDHDVDLAVREEEVDNAIGVLERAGFEVVRTHPRWLFKARLDGALVDVLYRLGRWWAVDDEMLSRGVDVQINGCTTRLISREDLALAQAGAASSDVPSHWYQAIDLLRGDVDWDYLARRGADSPELFKGLLHYARHAGISVPDHALG